MTGVMHTARISTVEVIVSVSCSYDEFYFAVSNPYELLEVLYQLENPLDYN